MILKHSNEKNNTRTVITFKCDKCMLEYNRRNSIYQKMQSNHLYDQDYCRKCWTGILNRRKAYREKMSRAIIKRNADHPEIAIKISKTCKLRKINCGDKNGMKQPAARLKVSLARKKMFEDPKVRQRYSEKTKEAWARGDFDGVRVGQCSWHDYPHSNGTTYKVQGKWELAFIRWLDDSNLDFKCHRGRIPYTLHNKTKNYYPDFWVDDWDCYAEVKCEYFYDSEKFQAIKDSNPDINVKILFKPDLVKLGVIL